MNEILDVGAEEDGIDSKTKEKIGNSALSHLNQQLIDFKTSDVSSNDGNVTPEPLDTMTRGNVESQTEYISPNMSTIKNFEVPKGALMPKPM